MRNAGNIKTLSLFAGGGGLDLGFSAAGFEIVLSTDLDPYSCRTLLLNQKKRRWYDKHPVIAENVANIDKAWLKKYELRPGDIDFIIGGPPCQSFSVFGKRGGLADPRGNLIWEYARVIDLVKPKGFLFENVAGLKTIHDGRVFTKLIKTLSFGGKYRIATHTYQTADHGIPQFRERVLIVGNRIGKELPPMKKSHGLDARCWGLSNFRTVREAFANLPEPGKDSGLDSHIGRDHSARIITRYRSLAFGERDPKTRINKLNPDGPSHAIIVGSDKGGGKGHVHPFIPREVTPRESARLQTFPDWWEFDGTGRHVIRQVGNAVPALFAAQLGGHIRRHLFDDKSGLGYKKAIERLGLDFLK